MQDATSVTAHVRDRFSGDHIWSMHDATGDAGILANHTGAVPGGDLRTIDVACWRSA